MTDCFQSATKDYIDWDYMAKCYGHAVCRYCGRQHLCRGCPQGVCTDWNTSIAWVDHAICKDTPPEERGVGHCEHDFKCPYCGSLYGAPW